MQKELIKNAIAKIVNIDVKDINIEVPKNLEHGDLTTNIAMQLSRKNLKSPHEVAEDIKKKLNYKELNIDVINIVDPGFINIKFISYCYEDILKQILNKNYLNIKIDNPQKINIEYVSANPTGKLHVGHTRGAIFGDVMENLLIRVGHEVDTEYYINDVGNQMEKLGKSLKERYLEKLGRKPNIPKDGYFGKEIINIAIELKDEFGENKIDAENKFFIDYAYEKNMNEIKKDLKKIGVIINRYSSEREIYKNNKIEKTLEKLKKYTFRNDNALWLKTTEFGDDQDRVLIKSDGSYTYLMPDIVYHNQKLSRGYDKLIDILGADHHGYTTRIKAGLEALTDKDDVLDIELIQMVQLFKNGKLYVMSKRTGESLTIDDLINELGIDSIRFNMISRNINSQLDIDIDKLKVQDKSNYVYYIQYANARICRILEKTNILPAILSSFTEEEISLINIMSEYVEMIIKAAKKKEPHLISNYLYKIATNFHKYYNNDKIIQDDMKRTATKLSLIIGIQNIIKDGMNILGISMPDEM